ncbi:pentapeptide repeat-containing protein [Burkholderia ubonensis]|uniref:pentapeptide repeat-containing protein n=1 Tax=Burkholderia ubonensis TaxID=101571 RepID=UPI0039F1DEE6
MGRQAILRLAILRQAILRQATLRQATLRQAIRRPAARHCRGCSRSRRRPRRAAPRSTGSYATSTCVPTAICT